jgi:hypothetical protein
MAGIAKNYHYFLKWVFIKKTNIYEDKIETNWRIEKRQCGKCGRKFRNGQILDSHKKQCGVRNEK